MAMQLGALRDALVEAGASPATAAKASEELAGYDAEFGKLRADIALLRWMTGTNLALCLAILLKLFVH